MKTTYGGIWTGITLLILTNASFAKGPRNIQDTPVAIDVISSESLISGGANTAELLENLRSGNFAPSSNSNVELRGFGGNKNLVLANGRRFLTDVSIGDHGDPSFNNAPSQNYANIEVLTGGTAEFGRSAIAGAISINGREYDGRIDTDNQDGSTIDFHAAFNTNVNISDSVSITSLVNLHYGDHGSLGAGYLRPGVQRSEGFDWNTRNSFNYRFDQQELGSEGWGYSTYLQSRGYNENGGEAIDSKAYGIGQEFRSILNSNTTIYVGGEFGTREWDSWDTFDSDRTRVFGGIRTGGDQWSADLLVGWEEHEYDDLDETHDNLHAELYYRRALTDSLDLSIAAIYGTHELFANEGGTVYVDPTGLLLAAELTYQVSDLHTASLNTQVLRVDSNFAGDQDYNRGIIGLDWNYKLNDTLSITPSINYVHQDNPGTGSENFTISRFGLTGTF